MQSRRRLGRVLFVTLIVCASVVLAGCTAVVPDDSSADSGGDGTDSADPGGDGDPGEASAVWHPLSFDGAATYTFDVYTRDQGTGTLVWDVTDASDDEATVTVRYEMADTEFESTVTGSTDDLEEEFMLTPAGPFLLLTVFSPTMGYYEGESLEVGNEWSYSSGEESVRTAVTGTDSYAGVDCYVSVLEVDGTVAHEGCVSPDLGLAPYSAYYDEEGELEVEMELVGFSTN